MNLSIGSEKFESQINAYKAFVNRQKNRQMDCSVSFHFWKYLINEMKNGVLPRGDGFSLFSEINK